MPIHHGRWLWALPKELTGFNSLQEVAGLTEDALRARLASPTLCCSSTVSVSYMPG